MLRFILLLFAGLLLSACDHTGDQAVKRPGSAIVDSDTTAVVDQAPATPFDLLNGSTTLHRFETLVEALSIWRQYTAQQPTLLLLSNNPHLQATPQELRDQVAKLLSNSSPDIIAKTATDRTYNPLLLPDMAVDAALRSNWFGQVAWALPLRDPDQALSLEAFAEQLQNAGIADPADAGRLTLSDNNIFHGTLRNRPFVAAALPQLKDIKQPVIVHIDLSYFEPLYKNEVSTPLFDIIHTTLATLQQMHLQTLAVTFSYGHLDSRIALDVRFLGDVLSYLIEDPARLTGPIPANWKRQRDALYLSNFFQKEKIQELYKAQEQAAPDEAWIKFNLYRSAAANKEGTKALDYLAQAVALDPIYAIEYLELSNLAYERQRPDEALRMLGLAAPIFDDPFIKLQMAQLANELREKEKALAWVDELRRLEWSTYYYPQIPQYLSDFRAYVQTGEVPETSSNSAEPQELPKPPASPVDPARQRILH